MEKPTQLEQAIQALEAAEAKLRMKDEFVAKVSHELRTPLTSIKEGVSLILDGALGATTAEQRDFLKTINMDLDRLTDLINNMLDISKIEARKMRLMRSRVDLTTLLDSVIRTHQPILGHRKINRPEQEALPTILGDVNRLHQVFANLLSNAIKFTPDDGSITFQVSNPNGKVTVAIQDSGVGIAAVDIPKLFQKFSQVGLHDPSRARGSGLGLVVCKELVELHRGAIEVASKPGQGTTFTVHLPMHTDQLAIQEELLDLFEEVSYQTGGGVGMVTLQIDAKASPVQLKALAEIVAHHVHQGDRVVPVETSCIVVLAIADLDGLQAIVKRLRGVIPSTPIVTFGIALCSPDVLDVSKLIRLAQSSEGRALAAVA